MSESVQSKQMNRAEILKTRRELLLARSRLQRQQLIWQGAQLHHELRFVEMGIRVAQTVQASPILIAAITAGLALIKPRRLLWLTKTGLTSWRLWRQFGPLLKPLLPVLRSYLEHGKKSQDASEESTDHSVSTIDESSIS